MKRNITKGALVFSLLLSGSAIYGQATSATALSEDINSKPVETTQSTNIEGQASITALPGFPVFVNTGDPVGDDARYEAAKTKWYAENKRLVKKFYRQN